MSLPRRSVRRALALTGSMAVIAAALVTPAATADDRPRVAPIDAEPRGQTYAEWAVDWWRWALETPAAVNPLGRGSCEGGQSRRVWFLAGAFGSGPVQRTCAVPARTPLFFPLLNKVSGAFLTDPPEERTPEFLRAAATCTATDLLVEVDGRPVRDPASFYVSAEESDLFDVQLPADNVLGASPQDIPELRLSPSAQSGYYIFLRPLRRGHHTIRWTATGTCGTQDVTYAITVARRRW